jgi:ABC-2 type transport system permease protein
MQVFLIASIILILSFTAIFFSPESLIADRLVIGTINFENDLLFVPDKKLRLVNYDNIGINDAINDIRQGKIDSLLILEHQDPFIFKIYLPESEVQSSLILSYLKERFEILENKILQQNVNVINIDNIRVVGTRNKGSDYIYEILYSFLIPFLFLVPIFLVGSLIIDIVTQEIESKTIMIIATAINLKRYFNEVILAGILMSFLQIIIWTILIQLRGLNINNIPLLMIYLTLFSFFICSSALLISIKFKSKSRSQLIYSILIMLISVSIGLSYLNPVAFISIIISDIFIASIFGYILIFILGFIVYYFTLKTEKKDLFL